MKNHNKLMLVFGKNSAWKVNGSGSSSKETDRNTTLNATVKTNDSQKYLSSSSNSKSFSH